MQGDAHRTAFPSASYDLVHARTLLINVPDPAAVVTEMARLARPGGWVVVLEPDGGGSVCYPPHPAWDQLTQIFLSAQQADGADTFIGRRLPELFRRAGLAAIGVEAKADIYPAGHSRRTIRADLVRSMRPKILALGIASESELDEEGLSRPFTDSPSRRSNGIAARIAQIPKLTVRVLMSLLHLSSRWLLVSRRPQVRCRALRRDGGSLLMG
jgi:SAM-dependent methyltransferase